VKSFFTYSWTGGCSEKTRLFNSLLDQIAVNIYNRSILFRSQRHYSPKRVVLWRFTYDLIQLWVKRNFREQRNWILFYCLVGSSGFELIWHASQVHAVGNLECSDLRWPKNSLIEI
jgi:hypothetical protein